jgi:dipeptidyl aminopeptidase/acylaminoacyl peptidase
MKTAFAVAACALATSLAQAVDSSPIAIEKFFSRAAITGAAISPDGRDVLLRMRSPEGRSMLGMVNTETRQQKIIANFSNADVDLFFWQNDMWLGYSIINAAQDGSKISPGLHAVSRDGDKLRPLTPTIVAKSSFADNNYGTADYRAAPSLSGFRYHKTDAMFALVSTNGRKTLTRIDIRSKYQADISAPRDTYRWLIDPEGEVRIAVARRDGKDVVYHYDGGWSEVASFAPSAPEAFEPLLFLDGTLYVRTRNGSNESSIYRYDLQKKALEAAPMISVPGFDADGYFLLDEQKMLGFRINTDSENTVWFDPAMKAMQEAIDAALPNTINTISYGAHSATPFVLVDAHSDVQDHLYLLFNRETKKLLRLGAARPDLDPTQMAPMRMAYYPARDGLQIPLYLTVPARAAGKPRPTVVLVGDSQWRRTASWEWNDEVQFLASRGYTVLQPQPRGIRGFGAAHVAAGTKGWPFSSQDDIADAVKWAVAQGHTDPARVCIAGAGYGGYAAMMELIRDPALFKCGISWSGIIDMNIPKSEAALRRAASPLHNAARIQQPVLLAYGKDDARVPFSDGRKFYEALSATNPNVEWREYTPSVEDWKTQGNRIDLWRSIEAFLAKNIGAATPGS